MPDQAERRVGVVIPYYQREAGLLRRALDSVAAQQLAGDVRLTVVVVDDGSPLPVDEEAKGIKFPHPHELMIIRQQNAGPGAARNAALDRLDPGEIDYVAFLDSDDRWYPQHLATALRHLQDSDFHFANVDQDERDLFSYSRYVADHHERNPDGRLCPASRTITGAEAFEALLCQCFVHTSQVVYRFQKFAGQRFKIDQGRAGEDLLFWLELTRQSAKVSYSAAPMGARGWGISIYRESLNWDSANAIDSLIDGLKVQQKIKAYAVSPATQHMLRRKRQKMRDGLTVLLLREIPRRPYLVWRGLARLAKEVPEYLLLAPISLARVPAHLKKTRIDAAMYPARSDVLEA
jgi:succinoglycan biosynthesis protein ExoW